jgi:hypothetical protein
MCIPCVLKRYTHDKGFRNTCRGASVKEINDEISKILSAGNIPDYLGGFLGACEEGNLDVAKLLLPHIPKYSEYSEQYHQTYSLQETTQHSQNMEYLGLYAASMDANFPIIEYVLSQEITLTQEELNMCLTITFYHMYVYRQDSSPSTLEHYHRTREEQSKMRYNCFQIFLQHGARLEDEYRITHAIRSCKNEELADIVWLFAGYDSQDYIFYELKTLDEKKEFSGFEEYFSNLLYEEKKIRGILYENFPLGLDNLICDFLFSTNKEKLHLFCAKYLPTKIQLSLLLFLNIFKG